MSVKDDPRQVLAILNSLGVVGLTADELKAFMKELKLYRKIKEREQQQWKDELREKIYKKQYDFYQRNQKSVPEPKLDVKPRRTQPEKPKEDKTTKKKTVEIIVDTSGIKPTEKKVSAITVTTKPPTRQRSCSKSKENIPCKKSEIERPASAPEPVKIAQTRQSRRRTRSVTEKEALIEKLPRSKSFIRSKSLLPESRPSKKSNDPVALYEKYSAYWNTISFPGEESHAKLRWSVREKMLGSSDSKYSDKRSARTNGSSSARSGRITVIC